MVKTYEGRAERHPLMTMTEPKQNERKKEEIAQLLRGKVRHHPLAELSSD